MNKFWIWMEKQDYGTRIHDADKKGMEFKLTKQMLIGYMEQYIQETYRVFISGYSSITLNMSSEKWIKKRYEELESYIDEKYSEEPENFRRLKKK